MGSAVAHDPVTGLSPHSAPAPNQLPQFIYWAWRRTVWNIPLAGWVSCAGCAPALLRLAEHGQLESRWLRISIT